MRQGEPSTSRPALNAGRKRRAAVSSAPNPPAKRTKRAQAAQAVTPRAPAAAAVTLNDIPAPTSHPRPSRRLLSFGSADHGVLGLGASASKSVMRPRVHPWFEAAVENGTLGGKGAGLETAYAGGMHSLAVDEAGKVWSWGVNDQGTLGRKTTGEAIPKEELEHNPMLVQGLDGFRVVQVAAGDSISLALSNAGRLLAWGTFRAASGVLGFSSTVNVQPEPTELAALAKLSFVSVACGDNHVLALTTTGHVYAWGDGQAGQLGRRIMARRKLNMLLPERLALRKIVRIGAGANHSFAQDASGVVYAWGLDNFGQTGLNREVDAMDVSADNSADPEAGSENVVWTPTPVAALHPDNLDGRRVVQFAGGEHHSLFLLDDGSVYACGRADYGQPGLGDDQPIMQDIAARKAERRRLLVEDPDGRHAPVAEVVRVPTLVRFPPADESTIADAAAPVTPIAQLSAGTRHNLAVSRAGHVYSWGLGLDSQLGQGPDDEELHVPTRISNTALSSGFHVDQCSAGGMHCILLAFKPDGA